MALFPRPDPTNRIHRPLRRLAGWESEAIVNFVAREFVHKSDIAADVLAEARRLFRSEQASTTTARLLARARELVVEIEAMVGFLDPQRSRYQIATTSALRVELDRLEAAWRERQRAARRRDQGKARP